MPKTIAISAVLHVNKDTAVDTIVSTAVSVMVEPVGVEPTSENSSATPLFEWSLFLLFGRNSNRQDFSSYRHKYPLFLCRLRKICFPYNLTLTLALWGY